MSSVKKSLDKFKSHIEKGSVYEGQQYIKTVYHRLRSRKLLQDSRELLKEASCIQLGQDEVIAPFLQPSKNCARNYSCDGWTLSALGVVYTCETVRKAKV